ncbi:structural maintenance of chromosome-like protein [Aureococcus anophagefferens]|uniref:Structural maintenance of chromosome-like protein n=1 Tax=Aureococcus anophagefferens TaxID=44056 RepID=A0ABR1G1N7_AURAN
MAAALSIKTISISGFRSFRQQDAIESFDPGHNALIGRNGSGKSNFFDAVQFVLLSPRFYNLRQEERQQRAPALLHEGAGANAMSAYVEIVFDNGGGRIPLEGDEVVLRRALGVKKDEFFVNRRRVTKKEVEGLLENAGFSRANPYYIVQQGKVNALCVMKDEERLALLKEVGGAGVYEAKRKEAVRTLGETEGKRATIGSVVATIEERLGELEGEKDELQRYERLDREHRALAYGLYDAELQKARRQLEDLEDERAAAADAADAVHEAAAAADRDVEAVETRVAAAQAAATRAEEAKSAAQRVAAGRRDDLRRLLPGHTAPRLAALALLLAESPELAAKCLGPLADHVHLAEDKYRVAVEVAAGPRLFHVVVEDDAGGGDDHAARATLEAATRYASEVKLDAITLEGDELALRCRDAEDALRAFHPDRVARADRAAADLEAACGDARRRLKRRGALPENATGGALELEELAEGGARRVALQRARDDARAALDDAEGAARALEAALEGRLRAERDDLQRRAGLVARASQEEDDDDGGDDAMDESDDEGAAAEGESAAARADRVEALEAAAAHADAQALEEARAARQALADDLADAAKTAEKLVSRRAVLLQRREENMKKMQRVGALPAREVDAFKDLSIDELLANLATCNRDKAKFAHVNKKALDQYVNFADQRALLLDRRRELDEGATAIEDLIRTLDAKKDEAIDRTFRGVSKHFADVFSELVPDGEAKLVMVKRPVAEAPSQSSASSLSVDAGPFVGVQVAVQFPGAAAAHAHVSMNQLSGGQKALVALALVFAIQRCDPAPFYLFDEIDAALDANHRAAVAALVKRQAAAEDAPAQFITTTFRPEFVNIADAHFGISLHHKTSKLHHISKDDALAFITEINATSAPAP